MTLTLMFDFGTELTDSVIGRVSVRRVSFLSFPFVKSNLGAECFGDGHSQDHRQRPRYHRPLLWFPDGGRGKIKFLVAGSTAQEDDNPDSFPGGCRCCADVWSFVSRAASSSA